jgi:hypothetical protein
MVFGIRIDVHRGAGEVSIATDFPGRSVGEGVVVADEGAVGRGGHWGS